MRFQMNPIFRKELRTGARTFRFPLAITAYALFLSGLSMIFFTTSAWSYTYNVDRLARMDYEAFTEYFMILCVIQLVITCMIMPAITASAIAGERERQTLDLMLTAPVSPMAIVFGKLMGALCQLMIFIVASVPAMSLCFVFGGIKWQYILYFLISEVVIAFFAGAIGIFCSSVFKRTVASIIVTFIIESLFYLGILIVFSVIYSYNMFVAQPATITSGLSNQTVVGLIALILLFDPAISVADFMLAPILGEGIGSVTISSLWNSTDLSTPLAILLKLNGIPGLIITVLMGVGFMYLAARRIDSVRRKHRRRKEERRASAKAPK